MRNIALICGGQSAEHTISVISVKNILGAIDLKRFQPIIIGISRNGIWQLLDSTDGIDDVKDHAGRVCNFIRNQSGDTLLLTEDEQIKIDAVFPVLHGPMGEDGTIQGMFEMLGMPYVGSGHGSSYNCMDKEVSKTIFKNSGFPMLPYVVYRKNAPLSYSQVCKQLNNDHLFIKPARMGSSIGTKQARNENEYELAVREALIYDSKIIIEPFIPCREIECAVLETRNGLVASELGEIVPNHEFYTFDAKYIDDNGAQLIAPAMLEISLSKQIKDLAKMVFVDMGCRDMARVDFFIDKSNNRLYLNEVNTIPGFTKISMYPKLMGVSGFEYTTLITTLLNNALSRKNLGIYTASNF